MFTIGIVSDGYLSKKSKTLSIVTNGYLDFNVLDIPIIKESYSAIVYEDAYTKRKPLRDLKNKQKLLIEDDEIVNILKMFLQCQQKNKDNYKIF